MDVLRAFSNTFGYAAGEIIPRTEVERLLREGVHPHELREVLRARLAEIRGVSLGRSLYADGHWPVPLPEPVRRRHMYLIGATSSGKTTQFRHLIGSDLAAGRGLAFLTPEAETVDNEILPSIPESRLDDVVVIDPADPCPVPFNPLHLAAGEDIDLKAGEVLSVLNRVCDGEGVAAPRLEVILREAVYAELSIPGMTLAHIERLVDRGDESFRRWVIGQLTDERSRHFWSTTFPSYPRDAHLSLVNRLNRFLRPRVVRNFLCQPGRSFNFRSAMDRGQVLLLKISDGALGEENAELIGQLIVAQLQISTMSRADMPPEERRSFSIFVDEFQRFAKAASGSYEQMFSRARKYNVAMHVAHQNLAQIGEPLLRSILGNVGTAIVFRVGATDARRLARELVGDVDGECVPLDPKVLQSLRTGEAVCRIGRNVFRLLTPPPPQPGSSQVRAEVIARSRARYGAPVQADVVARPEPAESSDIDSLDPTEAL